jgi:CoA:oxalate CoA-transferase
LELWRVKIHSQHTTDLITDPRRATVAARKQHEELVEEVAADWAQRHAVGEVVAQRSAASILASPIYDSRDVVQEDHFHVREVVCEVEHPTAGKLVHYGVAPKFSRTPARVRTPAPVLGQDKAEVYGKWLGYTAADLPELRQAG